MRSSLAWIFLIFILPKVTFAAQLGTLFFGAANQSSTQSAYQILEQAYNQGSAAYLSDFPTFAQSVKARTNLRQLNVLVGPSTPLSSLGQGLLVIRVNCSVQTGGVANVGPLLPPPQYSTESILVGSTNGNFADMETLNNYCTQSYSAQELKQTATDLVLYSPPSAYEYSSASAGMPSDPYPGLSDTIYFRRTVGGLVAKITWPGKNAAYIYLWHVILWPKK